MVRRWHCQQLSLAQPHCQLLTSTIHLNTLKRSHSVASPNYYTHPVSTLFLVTDMSSILFPSLRIYFMFSNFIKTTLSSKFPKSFSCKVKNGDNATIDLFTIISFNRLRYNSCNLPPNTTWFKSYNLHTSNSLLKSLFSERETERGRISERHQVRKH